jgi:predicted nucleotidyltransferase
MEQADVVRFTLDVLDRLGIEYAIVGSFASIAYGEPRFTRDIDILIAFTVVTVCQYVQGVQEDGGPWQRVSSTSRISA